MVNKQVQSGVGPGDHVQDVGVSRVPGTDVQPVHTEGPGWRLNLRAVRAFNVHIQSKGKHSADGCDQCQAGLEGILETVEAPRRPTVEVAEGGGADQAKTTPPPRDRGSRDGQGKMLW